jgi:hypothetical protein
MDAGGVVEQGSHQSLLKNGGLYAESWREQMRAGSEHLEEEYGAVFESAAPAIAGRNGHA